MLPEKWKQFLCSSPGSLTMTCPGDNGGPMICNGKLYGIFSFYLNYKQYNKTLCGSPNMQTAHTFTHFHLKWVNSVINSGNSIKPHLTLHAILTIFLYSVLTII